MDIISSDKIKRFITRAYTAELIISARGGIVNIKYKSKAEGIQIMCLLTERL